MKKFIKYYYGNTSTEDHKKMDKFIIDHKDEKNFYLSLYFSTKRLKKEQRAEGLFWDGCMQEFNSCKTEDLSKYNGLYDFETAFRLFKEFKLMDEGELIRLNYNTKYRDNTEFVLVRGFDNKKYYKKGAEQ